MVGNVTQLSTYESPDIQKYQYLIYPGLMHKKACANVPSIIIHFISEQGCGGAGASPSCCRLLRGWVQPRQVTSSSQHQHVETNNHSHLFMPKVNVESPTASGYQNSRGHGQNMQILHRKVSDQRDSNPNLLTVTVRCWLCLKMIQTWKCGNNYTSTPKSW